MVEGGSSRHAFGYIEISDFQTVHGGGSNVGSLADVQRNQEIWTGATVVDGGLVEPQVGGWNPVIVHEGEGYDQEFIPGKKNLCASDREFWVSVAGAKDFSGRNEQGR